MERLGENVFADSCLSFDEHRDVEVRDPLGEPYAFARRRVLAREIVQGHRARRLDIAGVLGAAGCGAQDRRQSECETSGRTSRFEPLHAARRTLQRRRVDAEQALDRSTNDSRSVGGAEHSHRAVGRAEHAAAIVEREDRVETPRQQARRLRQHDERI